MKKDLDNLFYLAGQEEEPNYYIQDFPSKTYDQDTWRIKSYFEEFWLLWPNDEKNAMEVLKKVWVNHALNSPARVPFKKTRELTEEYVLTKCVDECPMCGKNMWYGRCVNGISNFEAKPSLDRLMPGSKGGKYIDGNVWIVCKKCNTYKNDQDLPEQMRRGADAWEKEILISDKFLEEREESPLLEFYT